MIQVHKFIYLVECLSITSCQLWSVTIEISDFKFSRLVEEICV